MNHTQSSDSSLNSSSELSLLSLGSDSTTNNLVINFVNQWEAENEAYFRVYESILKRKYANRVAQERSTSRSRHSIKRNLVGPPTFSELQNGRLKCVETGHELLPSDKEMYSNSKSCRLGLVDFAVSNNEPPFNMFKPDPLNRSRLINKLTGDTVNKSEEHIWKHLNGRRFLNKLELKEMGKLVENEEAGKKADKEENGEKKKKTKREKKAQKKEEIISEGRDTDDKDSDSEEDDFWIPPAGERWDQDDGGDRWGSDEESRHKDEENDTVLEDVSGDSEVLTKRTKRTSTETGPSSSASRKKKKSKDTNC